MGWPLIYVVRRGFRNEDQWGELLLRSMDGRSWEKFCSSYELPWIEDAKGKSASKKSRIKEGDYDLKVRVNGPKGWRLELIGTSHRKNIQIHRAHKSMYIQGCILPVDFVDFRNEPVSGIGPVEILKKGDKKIQVRSEALMENIKSRYNALSTGKAGRPIITIAATLPAYYQTGASRNMTA